MFGFPLLSFFSLEIVAYHIAEFLFLYMKMVNFLRLGSYFDGIFMSDL